MEFQRGWILVVDADREIHGLYRRTLAELGFGVELCFDGAAVTLALARHAYHLILLDTRMPGVSAIEVLAQAYRQPAPPAVVVLREAPATQGVGSGSEEAGMLCRPISAASLR